METYNTMLSNTFHAGDNETRLDSRTKTKILVSCLLSKTIGNMAINNLVSFLPIFIDEKNLEL